MENKIEQLIYKTETSISVIEKEEPEDRVCKKLCEHCAGIAKRIKEHTWLNTEQILKASEQIESFKDLDSADYYRLYFLTLLDVLKPEEKEKFLNQDLKLKAQLIERIMTYEGSLGSVEQEEYEVGNTRVAYKLLNDERLLSVLPENFDDYTRGALFSYLDKEEPEATLDQTIEDLTEHFERTSKNGFRR